MGRLDLVSILGGLFLGLIFLLLFDTSPEAKDVCLRIAVPEIHVKAEGMELYRRVMEEAGICVKPAAFPQVRAIAALETGKIDGVLAGQEDFSELVGVPVRHGDFVIATLPGFLIVPKGRVTSFSDLSGEVLGVPLGATWPRKLVDGYPNIVRVPRGAEMLKEMLHEGRIDAILLDGYSLQQSGGVPDGYKAIQVKTITVYSWLRAEFSDLLPQFDNGTKAYLKAIGYDG